MTPDPYDIIKILIGTIVAMGTWIALREIWRVGKHGNRISTLERRSVNREELQTKLADLQVERLRLHAENSSKLDEIIETTRAINTHAISLATSDVLADPSDAEAQARLADIRAQKDVQRALLKA